MNSKKLVIFDCDGVLVDSEKITKSFVIERLNSEGIKVAIEEINHFFNGQALNLVFKDIESRFGTTLPSVFDDEFKNIIEKQFEKYLVPIPHVAFALESLECDLCVASSSPLERIFKSLRLVGLDKFFRNNVFSSYEINSWKPEPRIFEHAAESMNYSVNECVVVEDSPMGALAAKRAGMKCLGYSTIGLDKELQDNGAIVFDDMRSLSALVNKIGVA